jgi:hypothetical protein
MPDVQTFEVDAKLAPLNVGPLSLYPDRSSEDEQLTMRSSLRKKKKNTNMAGG